MLTQKRLKELLHYDPDTGVFTRLVASSSRVKIGDIAGSINKKGYIQINVDGKKYQAHRLANLYMLGFFPEYGMDHKFGDKADNRWALIEEASPVCNGQNCKIRANTSGFTGVSWITAERKWAVSIMVHKKPIHLGAYKDKIEAALVRITFEDWCPLWKCNHQNQNRIKLRNLGYKV